MRDMKAAVSMTHSNALADKVTKHFLLPGQIHEAIMIMVIRKQRTQRYHAGHIPSPVSSSSLALTRAHHPGGERLG